MRESWRDPSALEAHIALPHFQAFIAQMDSLLAELPHGLSDAG